MDRTDVAFSAFPIVMMLGLGALVLCLVVAAIVAASKKGTGGPLLAMLLCVGLLGGGLMAFMFLFQARLVTSAPMTSNQAVLSSHMSTSHHAVAEPTFAIGMLLVVGLLAILVIAAFVAAVRKGGGWAVLGLVVLGVPAFLMFLMLGTKVSYMDASLPESAHAHYEDMLQESPLIEMGPASPVAGEAIAEITDWSDDDDVHVEIDAHGTHASVGHDTLEVHGAHGEDGHDAHGEDGHDTHGEDGHDTHVAEHNAHADDGHGEDGHSGGHFDNLADSAILPSPEDADHNGISHAPIIISKLPENRPEWVDQTDGKWDDEKKAWTQTVQIGPYDDEEACQVNLFAEVYEATKDFAQWHVAGIPNADAAIRNYNPNHLPGPRVETRNYGSTSSTRGNQSYETRNYRRGHVRETYHTTVETSVSDDPMPVVFARVEFDQDYRERVNGSVRHGLSFNRAIKAGSVWGIGLLGLVATLGGLRLAGAKAAEPSVKLAAAKPLPVVGLTSKPKKRFLTKKRFMLILAPVICTVIYQINYMETARGVFGGQSDVFWPIWVWFGCGIAFAMTFMPGADKTQSATTK